MDRVSRSQVAPAPSAPSALSDLPDLSDLSATSAPSAAKPAPGVDALYQRGFISLRQRDAAQSRDQARLRKADEEVVWLARAASEPRLKAGKAEAMGPQFLEQQKQRDTLLKNNYAKKGYAFAPNSGKDNNCLIISLLQHLTGNYQSNHDVLAARYRKSLDNELMRGLSRQQKKKFQKNQMLPADHIPWLLGEMAKNPSLNGKSLTIDLWMANAQGEPVSFRIGSGTTSAIIFQSANHFEAVTRRAPAPGQAAIAAPAPDR